MSGQKRSSQQVPLDTENNEETQDRFSQVCKEQEKGASTSQMKTGPRKKLRNITNTQGQGSSSPARTPKDQAGPQQTFHISLNNKNEVMSFKYTCGDRAIGIKAQTVQKGPQTQPGEEGLMGGMQGMRGVDAKEACRLHHKVEDRSSARASAAATAAQNPEQDRSRALMSKEHIVQAYPSLERERKIIENLAGEMTAKGINKDALDKLHSANFRELMRNSIPVKRSKLLSRLSDSVGFLRWSNCGNSGSATCFVLRGPFVLTCRHVVSAVVGEGVEPSRWADVIGASVQVTFDYEDVATRDTNCFSVEPWFDVSDETLDYAVLRLRGDGKEVPPGLYNGTAPIPPAGLIYVTGHPDGEPKSTDACAVIPQSRQDVRESGPDRDPEFIYMYTQRSFQKIPQNPDIATTFDWGASGSPVFDSHGTLVAMLTVGILDKFLGETFHLIEFGCAMQSILSDIQKKHKAWYEGELMSQEDVHMLSLE